MIPNLGPVAAQHARNCATEKIRVISFIYPPTIPMRNSAVGSGTTAAGAALTV